MVKCNLGRDGLPKEGGDGRWIACISGASRGGQGGGGWRGLGGVTAPGPHIQGGPWGFAVTEYFIENNCQRHHVLINLLPVSVFLCHHHRQRDYILQLNCNTENWFLIARRAHTSVFIPLHSQQVVRFAVDVFFRKAMKEGNEWTGGKLEIFWQFCRNIVM